MSLSSSLLCAFLHKWTTLIKHWASSLVQCRAIHSKFLGDLLTLYSVNPIYYVTFTTATLIASFVLFRGFNTNNTVNTISLLCGFLIIFTGVYLLNLSRGDPNGQKLGRGGSRSRNSFVDDGIPTDGLSGLQVRHSMQMRRSETFTRNSHGGTTPRATDFADRRLLGDDEATVGLRDLAEESESEDEMGRPSHSSRR